MKRINFSKFAFLLLLLSFAVIPISCGSDDSDPIVQVDPDADNDGVADKDDACPNEAGLVALAGCPDADSDGVADKDDSCPNEAGLAALGGCPDADNDGIADKDDSCPNEAGIASLAGCPEDVDAVESTEEVGPILLKINCGGPEVTIGAETFLEDQYFNGATEPFTNPNVTEIGNTDIEAIYLTERITDDSDTKGPFTYNIPVSNGIYTVTLHFAEIYWGVTNPEGLDGGEGSRIFDVDMESTSILNNFDIFKFSNGPAKAFTKMYDIEVTDGELTIIFEATTDRPKVSAIEIFGNGVINP